MILQQNGFFVTGGIRPCIIKKPTPWKRLLLAVENSMWGSSFGRNKHGYVKSMFHPAYRREVFEKVGLFNEKLIRTEDNEMNYRIRMAGYKLYSDDEIISWQYARNDLKKMIKQKFSNGYWIGLTLSVCPGCICLYHLMPFLFIFAIFFTTVLMFLSIWQIAVLMWIIYISFGISAMVVSVIKKQVGSMAVFMPILFLILHASYGMGTLVGILNIPSFKKY